MHWYLDVLKKYTLFTGRAGRQEFWMFVLFNFIISLVVNFIDATIGTAPALGGIYSLAVFLPALALSSVACMTLDAQVGGC